MNAPPTLNGLQAVTLQTAKIITLAVIAVLSSAPNPAAAQTVINLNDTVQRFQAWGTNINILAGTFEHMCYLRPAFCRDDLPALKQQYFDHLFDPNIGIGFNGVRPFAKPGQNPEILETYKTADGKWTQKYFDVGAKPWMRQDGTWEEVAPWATQMEILAAAKKRGADTFLLRAQGAPWWLTIAKDSTGNSLEGPENPNLNPSNYRAYADYVAGVAKRLGNAGYPIQSISLFEEAGSPPKEDEETGEIRGGVNDYLPIYYHGDLRQPRLVRELDAAIKAQGLSALASAANEAAPRATLMHHLSQYPGDYLQHVGIVGTHGYAAKPSNSDAYVPLRQFADSIGRDIEVTEDDWGGGPRDSGAGDTWATQVRMAKKLVMQIDEMRIIRWFLWNPGRRLVWFDFDKKSLEFHPQYYMLKFVANAIPAGSTMLKNTNDDAVAALHRRGTQNTLRLMVVNWSDAPKTHTFQFSNLGPNAAYTQSLITEATMTNPVTSMGALSNRSITVTLPPMSITSLVFDAEDKGNINVLKDRVRDAITSREARLESLLTKVNTRPDARKRRGTEAALTAITSAQQRLASLKARIPSISDTDSLTALLREVATELRVHLLTIPRVNILLSTDTFDASMVSVENRLPKFTNRTNRAETRGNDVSQVRALLAPLQADVDGVQAASQAAYDAVINLAPDKGDGAIKQANSAALANARAYIQTAREKTSTIRKAASSINAQLELLGF